MKTYIAIDIGASSGRLMKSEVIDGQLTLTEVHRFKNGFRMLDGFPTLGYQLFDSGDRRWLRKNKAKRH